MYKGYEITKAPNDGYFISKDGEQLCPCDQYQAVTIKECKELINKWRTKNDKH